MHGFIIYSSLKMVVFKKKFHIINVLKIFLSLSY